MYGQRSTPSFALAITLALVIFSPLSQAGLLSFEEFDALDTSESTIIQQNYGGFQWDPKWAMGSVTMDDFSYRDTLSKLSEAGSLVLLGIGVIGLWGARRRIRQPA